MTELESIMLRKIRRFKKELDIMEDILINGLQNGDIKPVKQKQEKYNPGDDIKFFNDDDFQLVWKEYIRVRIRKKASNTDRAIKGAVNSLIEHSRGNKEYAIKMIDKSVNSGWTGLFPLKEEDKPTVKLKPTNTQKFNYREEKEQISEEERKANLERLKQFKFKKV